MAKEWKEMRNRFEQ